jgi:peroxiredoxin
MTMNLVPTLTIGGLYLLVVAGYWLGWQLLRQNGRILLRLDDLEKRLEVSEFGNECEPEGLNSGSEDREVDKRVNRFNSRSLAHSKVKRDGLRAGTPAPNFLLPRADGCGRLSLEELRGRRVLLVFSDPHCGPCAELAPTLEKFHREHLEIEVVMISRGEPKENGAKIKQHRLSFPVLLQQHWEVSLLYGMFATPIAYLIDEIGMITNDAALGVEPILALMAGANKSVGRVTAI